jgi:hypothetical protein
MKLKHNVIFLIIDLLVLCIVLTIEIGLKQNHLIKILIFAVTVRTVLITAILVVGLVIKKYLIKTNPGIFFATIFFGYLILLLVYSNENGFDHFKETLISVHSSWKYFGQILFPYMVASITTVFLVKTKKMP